MSLGDRLLNSLLLLCAYVWETCAVGRYEYVKVHICESEENLWSWSSLSSFMTFGTSNLCVSLIVKHFAHWDISPALEDRYLQAG